MMVDFYAEALFNPHWGEQIALPAGQRLEIAMVFQGLDQRRRRRCGSRSSTWVEPAATTSRIDGEPLQIVAALGARLLATPAFLSSCPGWSSGRRPARRAGGQCVLGGRRRARRARCCTATSRPGCRRRCCRPTRAAALVRCALRRAARHWGVSLHFNKGLAGAPAEAIAAARDTATNPAVLDAFALVICAAEGPPAYPGIAGHEPDAASARRQAAGDRRGRWMSCASCVPAVGSYVAESDFFEPDWQQAFWGANYARLLAVKDATIPDGLFFVHHGVGSEGWSADGFTRLQTCSPRPEDRGDDDVEADECGAVDHVGLAVDA